MKKHTNSPNVNCDINFSYNAKRNVNDTAYMQNRLINSQQYLVVGLVGLVGLGLPLTVTIRVSRVSAMVSARFSIH